MSLPRLTPEQQTTSLSALAPDWQVAEGRLVRDFRFPDHYQALAFVNALAWISHRLDHRPDLGVGYNACRVAYVTHDAGGLTQRDFDCASKVDALFSL